MDISSNRQKITAILIAVPLLVAIATLILMTGRSKTPDFSTYTAGPERKEAFFSYFLPIVQARNAEILELREELIALAEKEELSRRDVNRLSEVATQYRLKGFDPAAETSQEELLERVDIVPPSLALAQAANESGWGTSRFAREGNNFFGEWCFEPGCGIVPKRRDNGKTHEVADFSSPEESVVAYIANLNRGGAYAPLREIRADLREQEKPLTGSALAEGLSRYSERGDEYIDELRSMIRFNKLTEYDRLANIDTSQPSG